MFVKTTRPPITSGHEAVWHGHIDIVFSSHHGLHCSDIAVKTVEKCDPDEDESEISAPPKKKKSEGNTKD